MSGKIEAISGPMFAGKTTELIRRLTRAEISGKEIIVFKPIIDDRYKKEKVVSHDGNEIESVRVRSLQEILKNITDESYKLGKYVGKGYDVIAIDEFHLFEKNNAVKISNKIANKGRKLIVTGLDTDFKGEPFSPMPELLAIADDVDKLTAICNICNKDATKTRRIIRPFKGETQVLTGAKNIYEPVCRNCYQKKEQKLKKFNIKITAIYPDQREIVGKNFPHPERIFNNGYWVNYFDCTREEEYAEIIRGHKDLTISEIESKFLDFLEFSRDVKLRGSKSQRKE